MMFCTVEDFWPLEVIDKSVKISAEEIKSTIIERITNSVEESEIM